jgi:hypothetical protein
MKVYTLFDFEYFIHNLVTNQKLNQEWKQAEINTVKNERAQKA